MHIGIYLFWSEHQPIFPWKLNLKLSKMWQTNVRFKAPNSFCKEMILQIFYNTVTARHHFFGSFSIISHFLPHVESKTMASSPHCIHTNTVSVHRWIRAYLKWTVRYLRLSAANSRYVKLKGDMTGVERWRGRREWGSKGDGDERRWKDRWKTEKHLGKAFRLMYEW